MTSSINVKAKAMKLILDSNVLDQVVARTQGNKINLEKTQNALMRGIEAIKLRKQKSLQMEEK